MSSTPSPRRSCAACCFSHPLTPHAGTVDKRPRFTCRFNPPEPGMGFPVVTVDDWCGKGQTVRPKSINPDVETDGFGRPFPKPVGYLVGDLLHDYTDREYMDFLESLNEVRCRHCGTHVEIHKCHCQNDE